jgi:hypothetical protein
MSEPMITIRIEMMAVITEAKAIPRVICASDPDARARSRKKRRKLG